VAVFQWNQGYSVGVGAMDAEHKRLIELIHGLYEAMGEGKAGEIMDAVIDDLAAYTRLHFKHEEDLMQRYGYPKLAEQRQAHREFVSRVESLAAEASDRKVGLALRTADFLKKWLVGHIQGMDKQYSSFFASRGVN
jgi:hemerythrin-like metal-binding protein